MRVAPFLIVAALSAAPAAAQSPELAAAVDARLDARTRAGVLAVADSARAAGLPTNPLLQKALEGASRGAEPARIVAAVQGLAGRMRAARMHLGPASTETELVAGAAALYLQVGGRSLEELRRARPSQSVALPLVVLADIIEQGVPRDTASAVIVSLAGAGATGEAYSALRSGIAQDIRGGAAPAAAAWARARALGPVRAPAPVPPARP
jgi:hypothetical protein